MDYIRLGTTELRVSRLCFGSLTVGPLQANLSIDEGAKIIASAFDLGINFIDTAKLYNTYPYIKKALQLTQNRKVIVASKSYDYTYEGMRDSVKEALEELGLKKLGIFSLHEQESKLTLRGHEEALRYLSDAKKAGIIDAVGVSTHAIEVVEAASYMDNIDVVHPIMNKNGLGIIDGTIDAMLKAIERAYARGKGIYAMKVLGGGNLMKDAQSCFEFALNNSSIHSVAVGMQSIDEIYANIEIFEGRRPSVKLIDKLASREKRLHIDTWCEGCGKCSLACQNKAITVVDLGNGNGYKALVNNEKCVLCGYCSAYCPLFCIKII
jgi:uncharacterized protein